MFVSFLRFSSVRSAGWLLVACLSVLAQGLFAQTGFPSANDGFDPRPNSVVTALAVQADGKTIIGGAFTGLAPNGVTALNDRGHLARINLDGTVDTSFAPSSDDDVSAIAIQADGRVLVASFAPAPAAQNKFASARITRYFTNGAVDASFAAVFGDNTLSGVRINALAVQPDGKILVGGAFKNVQSQGNGIETARPNLVRLNADGSIDSTFTASADGVVTCFALQSDGKILVGGGFTSVTLGGTTTTRNRLARFAANGALDSTFDPSANDLVSAIAIGFDKKIYVGGSFTSMKPPGIAVGQEIAVGRLVRLTEAGQVDDSVFHPVMNGAVLSIAVEADGSVLVGGAFTAAANYGASYSVPAAHLVRYAIDGALDTAFLPAPDDDVTQIAVLPDARIVFGGRFVSLNSGGLQSTSRLFIARVNPNGMPDTTFDPNIGSLYTCAVQVDSKLVLGGSFSSVAGVSRSNLVRVDAATGVVDTTFAPIVNGRVLAVAVQSDKKILIGGAFSKVNNVARSNIARLNANGTLDTEFDPNASGSVASIAVQSDGKILIGGDFIALQPSPTTTAVNRYYIARLNPNGTLDTTFDPHANSTVAGFAIQSDGKIIIHGGFTTLQPDSGNTTYSRTSIARLTAAGKVDEEFAVFPGQTVRAVALQADGKILIGGDFTSLIPSGSKISTTRYYFARLDSKGAFDTTFNAETNNIVTSIAVQADKKIVVGGTFIQARKDQSSAWLKADRIARFNEDGSVDTAFFGGATSTVTNVFVQSDSTLLLYGSFSGIEAKAGGDPIASAAVARLKTDGDFDSGFSLQVASAAAGTSVRAIAQQLDGRMILGGKYDPIAGSASINLTRVRANGTADSSFNPQVGRVDLAKDPEPAVNAVVVLPPRDLDLALTRPFVYLGSNGQLQSSFSTSATLGLTGTVYVVLRQTDGRILVGGSFQLSGDSSLKNLVRFNANGSLDTTFAPEPDSTVYTLTQDSSTTLLVGGEFVTIGSVPVNHFARVKLADGTVEYTETTTTSGSTTTTTKKAKFDPNLNGAPRAVVMQADGKILVGGNFTTVQPNGATAATTRTYLARFAADGTVDTTFNPQPNSTVFCMAIQSDKKIVLGGAFSTVQPNGATTTTARQFIARVNEDGTLDTAFDPKPNSAVSVLALQSDGLIIVGGSFTTFEPNGATAVTARNYLARLKSDGTLDGGYAPEPNSWVQALSLNTSDNSIIIGGSFNLIGTTTRNAVARLTSTGAIDSSFNPNANGGVYAVLGVSDGVLLGGGFTAVQPYGTLVVGGSFTKIGGGTAMNLVRLNNDGNLDSTFLPEPDGEVFAILRLSDGRLVVGGAFTKIAGVTRKYLARFNADGSLDTGFAPDVNGNVYAVALTDEGNLLIGGDFTTVGGVARQRLALLSSAGALVTGFQAHADAAVTALAPLTQGVVAVGGSFTTLGGLARQRIALINGSSGTVSTAFTASANATVNAIVARADGGFYVGGAFTTIGGVARTRLARFTSAGTLDTTFDPGADATVSALSIAADGKIVVGGAFSRLGGQARTLVGRVAAPEVSYSRVRYSGGTVSLQITGGVPNASAVSFESSTDDRKWTSLGNATRVGGVWQLSGVSLPSGQIVLLRSRGHVLGSQYGSAGLIEARGGYLSGGLPSLSPNTSLIGAVNAALSFSTATSSETAMFSATGLPDGLSINTATGLITGTPTTPGTYSFVVTATNGSNSISATYSLTVYPTGATSRLIALSCRAPVTGGSTVVLGLSVSGTGSKPVLLRVGGPVLVPFGVTNAIAKPKLRYTTLSGTELAANQGWDGSTTLSNLFTRLGLAPYAVGSADAAISTTATSGPTTMLASSVTGETGVLLAEIYDASVSPLADTALFHGLSVRGDAGTGSNVLTAGVAVGGSTTKRIIVRAQGPALAAYGVTGTLADPVVKVFTADGSLVASNDNWSTQTVASAWQVASTPAEIVTMTSTLGLGALPSGSKDSVAVIDLPPGAYTMQVSGADGGTGNAIVEVYEAP